MHRYNVIPQLHNNIRKELISGLSLFSFNSQKNCVSTRLPKSALFLGFFSMTRNNVKFKDCEAEIATGNPKSNESFSFLEIKILEHAFTLFLFSN